MIDRFPCAYALLRGGDPDIVDELAHYLSGGACGSPPHYYGAAKRAAARLERSSWGPMNYLPMPAPPETTYFYPLDCGSRFD